jgi:hypothetical protein
MERGLHVEVRRAGSPDGLVLTCRLTACKRLSHDCAYDEVRKKSGPKRGYVKLLEARLRMSLPFPVVVV